ncbi:MAG TPA: phosphatase PAP2 family protein [Kofleriaceae bacterium]|nr:phosphatase PAP2 family protein [Kofleriaceae bacterium]
MTSDEWRITRDRAGRSRTGPTLALVCAAMVAASAPSAARAEPPAGVLAPPAPPAPPAARPAAEAPADAPPVLLPPKPDTLAQPPDTLEFEPVRDGIITGLGATFWVLEETVLKQSFAPDRCRWCDRDGDGANTLNGVDQRVRDWLVWDNADAADTASNVTAYVVSPIVAFGMAALAAGREGRLHEWRENSLEVLEAMVIASAASKVTKAAFARKRPYAHFRTDQTQPEDPDENESFTSGHTTLAFSLAVAGGTVASIRGYKTAPWVWAIGLTAAAATGYFRIAADKHYVTDVLGGAATGAAIGWAVPWFLGRRDLPEGESPPPAPSPLIELRDGGAILGVTFVH